MKGTIQITIEGISYRETERCREMIHQLFEEGFFNIRSGSFTANFDDDGQMMMTEKKVIRRKTKPIILDRVFEQFKIETSPLDNSSVTHRI